MMRIPVSRSGASPVCRWIDLAGLAFCQCLTAHAAGSSEADRLHAELEAGIDWVDDDLAGTSDALCKFTLAPQVSLGGPFMSRPVVRAFVTYATWGDDFVGRVGGQDHADENDGVTAGMHMEVWW